MWPLSLDITTADGEHLLQMLGQCPLATYSQGFQVLSIRPRPYQIKKLSGLGLNLPWGRSDVEDDDDNYNDNSDCLN